MMATAAVLKFKKQTATGLKCSACGASAKAACNCGAPYVPAGQLAAAAVARMPERSNRAIAEDLGIAETTVREARKATARKSAVEKRTGRDGKQRKLPKRPEPAIADPTKEINAFHSEAVKFLTEYKARFDAWRETKPLITNDGKVTLMQAFYLVSDGFAKLAQELDGR